MNKVYKVKLKTTPEIDSQLKKVAGTYRKIYNCCMDAQVYRVIYNNNPEDHFINGTKLAKVMKAGVKDFFPFLKDMDKGLLSAAAITASKAFRLEFKYRPETVPYLSKKKANMKFKTAGNVQIFSDHIILPKLGHIDLTEVDRIPVGAKYQSISFSHDGINWFISVSVEIQNSVEELSDKQTFLDFNFDGDAIIDGNVIESITKSEKYLREERRYKKLFKKLKRQHKATKKVLKGVEISVSIKNKIKTKKRLDKVKNRLYNIKRDSLNKIIYGVAITKPRELHILTNTAISREQGGYLSRNQRKAGSKQLFNSLIRKLAILGTKVVRHSSHEEFLNALGSRV